MKKTLCNQKPFKWQGMNTRKKKKIAFRKTVTFSGRQDSITSLREWEATSIPLPYPSRMRRRREKPSSPSRFYLISWENISPACWEKESSQVSPLKCIHSDVNYHVVPSLGLPWWFSGKEFTCSAGDLHSISGLGRSLEKGMATHSSILAWRIPWTEEPRRLQSMGLQESDTTWWLNDNKLLFTIIFGGSPMCVYMCVVPCLYWDTECHFRACPGISCPPLHIQTISEGDSLAVS